MLLVEDRPRIMGSANTVVASGNETPWSLMLSEASASIHSNFSRSHAKSSMRRQHSNDDLLASHCALKDTDDEMTIAIVIGLLMSRKQACRLDPEQS